MRIPANVSARRGAIVPYVAISLVALCGFIALAIDLGMVMVAKTQAQNAADAAAFAGARTLTGGADPNTTQATANGQAAAAANSGAGPVHSGGERYHDARGLPLRPQFANVLSAISAGGAGQLQSVPGHDYAGEFDFLRKDFQYDVVSTSQPPPSPPIGHAIRPSSSTFPAR